MSAASPTIAHKRGRTIALNGPLLVGSAIVVTLLFCAIAAPALAPHDPLDVIMLTHEGQAIAAPYPPGTPSFPLGSDADRRDMLSRLLYGTRFTLTFAVLTAVTRVVIGAGLGLLAGWFPRVAHLVEALTVAVAAVPALLVGLIIVTVFPNRGTMSDTVMLALLLGLTGWTEITVQCQVTVREIRTRPFIEAARALGRRPTAILLWHVLPNLRNVLLVGAAYAVAAVLLLTAELGFLRAYIGGFTINRDVSGTIIDASHPDWSGMIADGTRWQTGGAWMLWEPMLLFAVAILGFYLLAEGLQKRR